MKKLIIILVLFVPLVTIGQDFQTDMKDLNESFYNLNKKLLITTENQYADGRKATSQKLQVFMKAINKYYLIGEEIEALITPSYSIVLSHYDKSVMIDSNRTDAKTSFQMAPLDTVSNYYSSVQLKKIGSGMEQYILVPKYGAAETLKITFSRKSMLLNRVEMIGFEEENGKKDILKMTYSYSNLPSNGIPKAGKFIKTNKQHKIELQPKYAGYELNNYYNQN